MTLPTREEIAEWRGWKAFNGPARINHHVPEDRTEWDRLLAAAERAIELEEAVRAVLKDFPCRIEVEAAQALRRLVETR